MFEKTQKAANELGAAVTADTTIAVALAKAVVVPAVSAFFTKIATAAQGVAASVEDGSIFKPDANQLAKCNDGGGAWPKVDPLPTMEQNNAIYALRVIGKSDEEIAQALDISVRTVKMCVIKMPSA